MWGNKGYNYIDLDETEETSPSSPSSYHSRILHQNPIKSLLVVVILTIVIVLLGCWFLFPQTFDFVDHESYTIVNVKLASSGNYLVTDQDGNIFTSSFPWLQGSQFKLQKLYTKTNRYQLKSVVTNTTLSFNTKYNVLQSKFQYFDMKSIYLEVDSKKYDLSPEETISFATEYQLSDSKKESNIFPMKGPSIQAIAVNTIDKTTILKNDASTILLIEPVNKIKGVNIGSWLIPERWMQPKFYDDAGIVEYWSQICGLVKYAGMEAADKHIRNHLDTWLTSQDFNHMIDSGVQSIRIPVGYWNLIKINNNNKFVPEDVNESLKYLDWAVSEAEKRGMTVLLDLHGAPGSQNGFDHR